MPAERLVPERLQTRESNMSQNEQQQDEQLSTQSLRDEAEKELREAAKKKDLHAGMKAAFKMLNYQPQKGDEALALFKELFPVSAAPSQSASPVLESEPSIT